MKQLFNTKVKIFLLAMFVAVALPCVLHAQPMPDANDVDTPIDGGLSLLVAAGAVAGAKKIRDSRKK